LSYLDDVKSFLKQVRQVQIVVKMKMGMGKISQKDLNLEFKNQFGRMKGANMIYALLTALLEHNDVRVASDAFSSKRSASLTAHKREAAVMGIELSTLDPYEMVSMKLALKARLNNTYEGQLLKGLVPKVSERIKLMTMRGGGPLAGDSEVIDLTLSTVVYYPEKQVFGFGYDAHFVDSDDEDIDWDDDEDTEVDIGSYVKIVDLKGDNLKTLHEDFSLAEGECIPLLKNLEIQYGKPMLKLK
jgi:hypothetical protein